jgi:hypothetical protein
VRRSKGRIETMRSEGKIEMKLRMEELIFQEERRERRGASNRAWFL